LYVIQLYVLPTSWPLPSQLPGTGKPEDVWDLARQLTASDADSAVMQQLRGRKMAVSQQKSFRLDKRPALRMRPASAPPGGCRPLGEGVEGSGSEGVAERRQRSWWPLSGRSHTGAPKEQPTTGGRDAEDAISEAAGNEGTHGATGYSAAASGAAACGVGGLSGGGGTAGSKTDDGDACQSGHRRWPWGRSARDGRIRAKEAEAHNGPKGRAEVQERGQGQQQRQQGEVAAGPSQAPDPGGVATKATATAMRMMLRSASPGTGLQLDNNLEPGHEDLEAGSIELQPVPEDRSAPAPSSASASASPSSSDVELPQVELLEEVPFMAAPKWWSTVRRLAAICL
jgi:hypothetical protein